MDPSSSSSSSSKRRRDSDSFDDEPSCKKPKYDVFLNYSFEDIGNGFISHLKGALNLKSFTTSDHTLLPAGEDAYSELSKAIEESEMFVVVFSPNYASSERCLDELVNLMDCSRKFGEENVFPVRKVLPVFFKVVPSDVRRQHGPFLEAFQAHETNADVGPERLKKWKEALKEAGRLAGLEILQYGDEAKFVKNIVKELLKMQSPERLHVTDHPLVGIESRAEELISTLRLDRQDLVLVVAVLGISGIGKTTVVKDVYNRIADQKFELSCFIADIDHIFRASNWKIELPNQLIYCLTRNDKLSIMQDHNDRVTKIKWLVRGKTVLLVLDGVDDNRQLDALGINPNWFGEGSRIIVITRDKRSLGGHMPYVTYHTRLLNRRESLHLFTQLLSASNDPLTRMIIEEGVNHAGGLPLVLKVWSGHFKNIKIEAWPGALEKLKRIPHCDVYEQLKMSYDSLTYEAKQLFLDIACFFYGTEKNLVKQLIDTRDHIRNLFMINSN